MECYSVKAMFGHVGRNNCIIKEVATVAVNGKDAANNVRWMGRVKHNRKDAIREVKKITYEEYLALKEENNNDPFFKCHSSQDQKILCSDIADEIVILRKRDSIDCEEHENKIRFMKRKQKLQLNDAYYQMRQHRYYAMEGAM